MTILFKNRNLNDPVSNTYEKFPKTLHNGQTPDGGRDLYGPERILHNGLSGTLQIQQKLLHFIMMISARKTDC